MPVRMADRLLMRAVLKVGGGRGFVVRRQGDLGNEERIVVTAAHCLEGACRADGGVGLPPCHPIRYEKEEIYKDLLGPLDGKPTVWARCLYVDPIADIAVLGLPDYDSLPLEKAEGYYCLMKSLETLSIADAPAQGHERIKLPSMTECEVHKTPGKGAARVLSLKGCWRQGHVERPGNWLSFEPTSFFKGGMSGSPIINASGSAIGVCSTAEANPVIVDSLSAHLIRSIQAAGANPATI
jgi:Trypsin-like peptidase domain